MFFGGRNAAKGLTRTISDLLNILPKIITFCHKTKTGALHDSERLLYLPQILKCYETESFCRHSRGSLSAYGSLLQQGEQCRQQLERASGRRNQSRKRQRRAERQRSHELQRYGSADCQRRRQGQPETRQFHPGIRGSHPPCGDGQDGRREIL